MKTDIEDIKKILKTIYEFKEPILNIKQLAELLEVDWRKTEGLKWLYHNLMILKDQELIVGVNLKYDQAENLGFMFTVSGVIMPSLGVFLRLTDDGHKVIEAMSQSKIWESIKTQIKDVTKEGLKLIPSLAIDYLKTQVIGQV